MSRRMFEKSPASLPAQLDSSREATIFISPTPECGEGESGTHRADTGERQLFYHTLNSHVPNG